MTHPHEIAFIDPAITDIDALLFGLRPDVEAIILSRTDPAVAQMARAVERQTDIGAIHVIAHGLPGEVSFAAGALSVETIDDEAAGLRDLGAALGAEGILSIWACHTGAGERGDAFTDMLAKTTGARVATAGVLVGATARGGRWALDRGVGAARSPLTAEGMATYAGVMATFNGTNGNDTANATTGTLTGFSGGTVLELQDSTGDVFNGGNGADTIVAGAGDDTINIANGQFVTGESITGGANTASGNRDQIVLTTTTGTTVDFSVGTVLGVETLTGSTGSDTVTMTAAQLAGFSTVNLGNGTDVLNVVANGNISALTLPSLTSVETGNLTGTSGTDTVTLTGAQLDAIIIGSGTINLGSGSGDTINLTSASADLNSLATNNNSIQGVEAISFAGAAAGVTLSLSAQTEGFAITGSAQADTITGGTGADTIDGGAGDDTINLASGQFVSGESIQGGANTASGNRDQIVLTTTGMTVDFSTGTVAGIETLTGSTGNDIVTMTAAQLAGLSTVNLGNGTDVLNVVANGNISALTLPSLTSVETGNLTGTSGTDTVTLTGAQLDAILIGSGTINLGSGSGDTINLTSTSADLNTLGATNNSIQNVDTISASGAAAGVTITLSGQTEGFTITGSNQADTITGGSGADTIDAGGGDDTINIANGQFVGAESIQGGANTASGNRDQIVLTSASATVDFSTGTVAGIETLTGSAGNDTVTMTAAQLAGFSTINLGSTLLTTDVLNVVANGNISALALPSLASVETGNLTGTSGTDTVTLTGAQLDAILIGSGTINLGSGSGDTINLTSVSADLNSLATNNNSIQGVEAISFAGAAAGVTLNLSAQTEGFAITGSAQADTITGGTGADTIDGGAGDDTINLATGQFVSGESIQGGANTASGNRDQIVLTTTGMTVDFSTGTVAGIETLTGSTGNDTLTLSASQWAGFSTINLGNGTDVLHVLANGDISGLLTPVATLETGDLVGTTGTNTITLTGAQLNAILAGSGTINLGSGSGDTINLTSTSTELNTLGATDASIQGVEAVSASLAAAGVTINLSGQTEAFTMTGGAFADTLTGGAGADTIDGDLGADALSGGAGNDIITYDRLDSLISGGANTDTLVVNGAATINLSSADQSSGDTANVSGFENVDASGSSVAVTLTGDGNNNVFTGGAAADTIDGGAGDDTINVSDAEFVAGESIQGGANSASGTRDQIVLTTSGSTIDFSVGTVAGIETLTGTSGSDNITLTATQWAGLATINLVSGTDAIDILATGNISTLGTPTMTNVDASSLVGTAGNDSITLTGAQLNAMVTGNGVIDLNNGTDTINLTSTSTDLNTLGDNSILDVEAISASSAAAGVTINLSNQTENFSITGSGLADVIVGGQGADVLNGGAGNDIITYESDDTSIAGGGDIDTLVINSAVTMNLSLTDQSSGDSVNVSGFENINASTSDTAVNLTGSSAANVLIGSAFGDILSGGLGDDTITGGAGNDAIDGGAGTGDTAVFSGTRANYNIVLAGSTYTLTDKRANSPTGTDSVTNVENFQFSDGTVNAAQLNPSVANKIALENMKQGNSEDEWGIDGSGSANIQGFATQISSNIGETVDFKIATDSTHYRIDIYRLGYYGGDGARKVASIDKSLTSAQIQPHPIVDMSRGLIDAGNWSVSASWGIPADAVSGVYFAKLVREDGTEGASIIPFIVRDDASTSNIVFQTSDTTWQAYNEWGGASLYFGEVPVDPADMIGYMPPTCGCGINAIGRATAISYNRPIVTPTSVAGGAHDFVFGVERSAINWLEQNGYDVSYISGVDTSRSGSLLLNHDAFLSVGHDEYWSGDQRANVEAARDAGVNLAFWSGNEVYWKVRWETSIDGNGTPYRTMVCYKETWGGTPDPSATSTGTWRDPRFVDPGQKPENALTGTMFTVDSYRADTITIPYDYSNLRFWRNTDVADLQPGQTASLVPNLLGYEWDSDVENGFRPAGLINMSLSTVSVNTYMRDYGTSIGPADVTHSLTMYRAESGALVFGAGTVFWSWGLSSQHDGQQTPTDPNVQQAMVNMFADMGIQPTTLDASLILATQSTDTTKPTSTITSPTLGAAFVEGQKVTITGTAQDFGGGIIAGVEVSTDGGLSWWKATGRETWSYSWNVQASGTYTILSRAVDDSLNLGTPSAGAQVTVNLPSTSSLWTLAKKPGVETALDRDEVTLGVRFQAATGGFVNGIRFYKGFYNVGAHEVDLWTSTGTLLATGVSVGESLSGWQTVTFSSPVHISAGTTYVASYHTDGYYSLDTNYFASTYQSGPLTVLPNGGVYIYGDAGLFPTNASSTNSYLVDVVFNPDPNNAPTAIDDSGFSVGKDGTLAISFAALTANDTDPDGNALTVTAVGNATNGTVTLDAQTGNVLFTPNAGYSGPASFSYTVSDVLGASDTGNVALTIVPAPDGVSLFQSSEGSSASVFNDGTGLELGMRFTASNLGTITGIRFYKPAGAVGTHTGSLWSSTGTLLATVTFSFESTSGWQTATFSNPVQITQGTTYIASYHTSGAYVATANYFTTDHTRGALTAPTSTANAANGLFVYSSVNSFPTFSSSATNYWVDVVYNQSTVPNGLPIANNDNGYTAIYNTPFSLSASALLANDTDPDSDQLTVTGAGGAQHGTVAFNAQTGMVTFTPTSGYSGAASFTYDISDGRGGTASATVNMTVGQPDATESLFSGSDTPAILSADDSGSIELGVKFTASVGGTITGLRYYKGANDTGTHTGSLWTSGGALLGTATFTNESSSGWQTVTFAQPIQISVGATYVASYHSNGFYTATQDYFTTSHTSGSLTAPSSTSVGGNGVYTYGTGSLFPTATFSGTNYWVDVLFDSAASNIAPVANNDPGFSTQFNTVFSVQGGTLLANDNDANGDPLVITGVSNFVNGTAVFNAQNNVVTFTPTSGYSGAASFDYTISDGRGGTATAQVSLNVDPQNDVQNLFSSTATPTTVRVDDAGDVELGMKFQADVAGSITGFRFYKGADNIGPHEAHLWTSTGTLLATATFTNETASGWQSVDLADAVAIDANTTYVVSYHSDGFYSATGNFFQDEVSSNDLHALSNALSGGNGVYGYGASGLFPTNSFNATNYYVDVAFKPLAA